MSDDWVTTQFVILVLWQIWIIDLTQNNVCRKTNFKNLGKRGVFFNHMLKILYYTLRVTCSLEKKKVHGICFRPVRVLWILCVDKINSNSKNKNLLIFIAILDLWKCSRTFKAQLLSTLEFYSGRQQTILLFM